MQRKTVLISLAIVTILVLASLSTAIIVVNVNNGNAEKTVINQEMRVKGIEKNGADVYKNIPYAEPPVDDLRFAAPVFKDPDWTGIRDCTQWGNKPIQSHFYTSEETRSTEHTANESEDCLYLNIWTPAGAKAGDNLPVYVWIHGGGMCYGCGQNAEYDGTRFANEGVIVVTIEYRLGALGFLCLDSLKTADGSSGNWGTLDQICALQWVQKYIGKFGGDKNNVTIGGESAGSFSVFNMVISPKASGLFQKAIMESGSYGWFMKSMKTYADSKAVSESIAAKFGATDSPEGVAKLREADPYELSNITDFPNYMSVSHDYCVWSTLDGVVLPEDPLEAIEDGEYNHAKMIIGYNTFEGLLFTDPEITDAGIKDIIKMNFDAEDWQAVDDFYKMKKAELGWSTFDCAAELTAMVMFKLGADKFQKLFSANLDTVYGYEFAHKIYALDAKPTHGIEIAFAFGQDKVSGVDMTAEDKAIMEEMHGHWVNFIKTGDPNGDGLAHWEKYNERLADKVMAYGQTAALMMPKLEVRTLAYLSPLFYGETTFATV